MRQSRDKKGSSLSPSEAHSDHLKAHEDHASWMKDLERWHSVYEEAVRGLVRRLLPELDLSGFEDAMDRHEAAIATHEELVARHESRIRRQRAGLEPASDDVEALHHQMHRRHEISRHEHQRLEETLRSILEAVRRYPSST